MSGASFKEVRIFFTTISLSIYNYLIYFFSFYKVKCGLKDLGFFFQKTVQNILMHFFKDEKIKCRLNLSLSLSLSHTHTHLTIYHMLKPCFSFYHIRLYFVVNAEASSLMTELLNIFVSGELS